MGLPDTFMNACMVHPRHRGVYHRGGGGGRGKGGGGRGRGGSGEVRQRVRKGRQWREGLSLLTVLLILIATVPDARLLFLPGICVCRMMIEIDDFYG